MFSCREIITRLTAPLLGELYTELNAGAAIALQPTSILVVISLNLQAQCTWAEDSALSQRERERDMGESYNLALIPILQQS